MKLKTTMMSVLVTLLFLALSTTAFAQQSCQVASTPVSRATTTGHTEPAGDITFICTYGGAASTAATLTVDYSGIRITSSTAYPAGKPISITGTSGFFAVAGFAPTIAAGGVSNSTGQIVINLPAIPAAVPGVTISQFTLQGVLVSLDGTGRTNLQATVSVSPGTNYFIQAGQNVATVITSVLDGIRAPRLTTGTTAGTILSSQIVIAAGFSITIQENYIDMYRATAQFNTAAATNETQLLLTFAGIPTGVTLGGCAATATPAGIAPALSAATITSTAPTLTVTFTGAADLSVLESIVVACGTVTIGTTAASPLPTGTVTVTATLAPTGSALSALGAVLTTATTGQIPRYAASNLPSPPLVVINIIPATTNFIIPFAVADSSFDTGIAIANTTTDPYGTAGAAGGARAQAGSCTLTFYPQTGSSFSLTTASAIGLGMSSSGSIESGRTWSAGLRDEILRASGMTGTVVSPFRGYIFIVCNFTNGHAVSFVTDYRNFTSASPVLVIPPPSIIPRNLTTTFGVTEFTTR